MRIWEAHNRLSLSLGDQATCTSSALVDGVRFTSAMRADYLYRAMLNIVQSAVASVAMMPRQQATELLTRLFPNSTITTEFTPSGTHQTSFTWDTSNSSARIPIFIYSMRFEFTVNATSQTVPIPLKTPYQANALLNTRNAQPCDMFAIFSNGITPGTKTVQVFKGGATSTFNGRIFVHYLGEPRIPSLTNVNVELDFDPIYDGKLLSLATYYGLLDSQDFDGQASQVLQQVAGPAVVIQPQGK